MFRLARKYFIGAFVAGVNIMEPILHAIISLLANLPPSPSNHSQYSKAKVNIVLSLGETKTRKMLELHGPTCYHNIRFDEHVKTNVLLYSVSLIEAYWCHI